MAVLVTGVARWLFRWISCACLLATATIGPAAGAQTAAADDLVISVLTFGPGDHPFSKFGHIALLVGDRADGTQLVYNYGTFAFDSAWLIPKFLMGKYRYWLSVQPLRPTLAAYAAENRSVVATPLRLSAAQKRELVSFLAWNARDENKHYVFDYYRDNCATRVRDLVDKANGGALHAASRAPATLTWRQHTQRLTIDDPWVYAGLYLAMGPLIDQPVTQWEEMFLPGKVEEGLTRAGVAEPGASVVLLHANRAPPAREPPMWSGRLALTSAVVGAALAALGYLAGRGRRIPRVGLGVAASALGIVLGAFGVLFVFLWVFTNHAVAYRNANVLQCSPLALWLIPSAYRYVRAREHGSRSLVRAALVVWASSLIGWLLNATPVAHQENDQVIAVTLPILSGLLLGAYGARSRTRADAASV